MQLHEPSKERINVNSHKYVAAVAGCVNRPLDFCELFFPWGVEGTPLAKESLDDWQRDILSEMQNQLLDAQSSEEELAAIQHAVASGHGIGKSALISMIIIWFMSCRAHPQVVVTANTAAQLKTKTWREVAKWRRLCYHGEAWLVWTATSLYHKDHADTWRANAIPWSEENPEGFAGTHENDVLVIFDEASAIPNAIWEVTEGAMTTHGAIWIAFGNPTRNSGRFYDCFHHLKHRWKTRNIDSRTARKTNKAQLQAFVDDNGEDSDRVRVRIKGEFPRQAHNQLISNELIDYCRDYTSVSHNHLPFVIAVDVARYGDDDSKIYIRQGRKVFNPITIKGMDTMSLADEVDKVIRQYSPRMVVVDSVGIGAGVYDRLRQMGHRNSPVFALIPFNGANKARKENMFTNRRTEGYVKLQAEMVDGIDLPDIPDLRDDLRVLTYEVLAINNKIKLLPKDEVKEELGRSPDDGDALMMLFAEEIVSPPVPQRGEANLMKARGPRIRH